MEKEFNTVLPKNIYSSLSVEAARLSCSVNDLQDLALCGNPMIYAQAVTGAYKGLDGNEEIYAPIFQISTGQLKKILDNNGAVIDPDINLGQNVAIWLFGAPRQIRVEVNDLRVLLPESANSKNAISGCSDEAETQVEKLSMQPYGASEIGISEQEHETNNTLSEVARALKKKQTAEIDVKITAICETIKDAAKKHMNLGREERVINHARFIDEAEIAEGKKRARALKLVKEFISGDEAGLKFQEFKYANKPVKSGKPHFLSEAEGLVPIEK